MRKQFYKYLSKVPVSRTLFNNTCLDILKVNIALGISGVVFASCIGLLFAYVVQDRIEKYPHLIEAVTIDEIARVARRYLDYQNYSLAVVGP